MPATKRSNDMNAEDMQVRKKRCKSVLNAVAGADLPKSTLELMDASFLENSLCIAPASRHRYQSRMVEAMDAVFEGVQRSLQSNIQERESKQKEAEDEMVAQEAAAKTAGEQRSQRHDVTDEKKRLLADVTNAFRAAKLALADARGEETRKDAEVKAVVAKEATLKKAFEESIKPLVESGADAGVSNVPQVMKLLGKHEVNESLLNSLPELLTKKPEARATFDTVVVNEVVKEINGCLDAMRATIDNAASDKETLASKTKAEQESFDAQLAKLLEAAAVFQAAQTEEKEADTALNAAVRAQSAAATRRGAFAKACQVAVTALERFQSGPQAAFVALRDGPPQQDARAEVEEPPTVEQPIESVTAEMLTQVAVAA